MLIPDFHIIGPSSHMCSPTRLVGGFLNTIALKDSFHSTPLSYISNNNCWNKTAGSGLLIIWYSFN